MNSSKRQRSVENTNKKIQPTPQKEITIHYNMTWKDILTVSITSLYIVVLLSIIMFVYIKLTDIFHINSLVKPFVLIVTHSWIALFITFILLSMIVIGVRALFTYVKYSNYQVASDKHYIYITNGTNNKKSMTISKQHIYGIIMQKSFINRLLQIAKVKLICNHTKEEHIETQILLPFIHWQRGKQLIKEILPDYNIQTKKESLPNEAYFVELIQPSYLLVIFTFLVMFFWPEYWLVPVLYVLYIIIKRIIKTKQQRYCWTDDVVCMKTGTFSTEEMITKRSHIDAVVIEQSWLERKLGLASIKLLLYSHQTKEIMLNYINVDVASQFYHWYKSKH